MEHGGNKTLAQGKDGFIKKGGSTDTMMGAMSIRKSLSPLHAECEALIWAM